MSLTPKQVQSAYANGSVAVTAGAGTGKTHMLAERYLYHLRVHEFSPLEVVATTFTDKAAAELRSRIRSLVTKQLPDRTDWLAELEAAQISTIHALAARICREHPLAAGVPPDFTVLDELEGVLWSTERIEEAFDTLPAYLYEQVPYSLMSSALSALIKDPIAAERSLDRGTENWSQLATQLQQQAKSQLLNHPVWQQTRLTLHTYAGKPGDRLEEEVRKIALQAIAALEQGDAKEPLFTIDKLKVNMGSQKNWPAGALEIVKTAIKELRELAHKTLKVGLVTLEIGSADQQLTAMLPALREAFQLVRDYLTQVKRRSRMLDFADLEVHALRAMRDPQVQSYYGQRWKAFLVDEFQDTNSVQAELLEFLTSSTLLTIVGDAKQAIYGFRRADGSVFRAWCDRIQADGGNEVVLDTSFRTHQKLVQQINQIFAPVLGTLHQNLEANRTESPHPSPHLRIYAVQAESGFNKPQRLRAEGIHIAQMLKEMLDDKIPVHDKSTGSLRPIVPGDIAILSRTWEPLELYGEALASLGIPVAPAGGGNLLATREASDAWALLRFLADPTDDLALVAVLRSPFFAVSDRVLFTFAQNQEGRGGDGENQSKIGWWQGLKEVDIPEVTRPVEVLGQLIRERAIEPPTRLLQLADRLTGYTSVIANLPGAARREADWRGFLKLVRHLEQGTSDVFSVVRRLKRLVAGEVEIPRLPLSAQNAVALMTIHAAKGLEWPVVVVPDLTRSMPNNAESVYFDPELGVALKLEDEDGETQKPVLYLWLEQLRKQRQEAEALRVLYVALTRARDHLILTAADDAGGGLHRLQLGLDAAGIPLHFIPFDPESARPPTPPEQALLPEPPRLLIGPVASGLFELPVTALSEYACCPKRFQFRFIEGHPGMGKGTATAQRVGTLVHLALERAIRDIDTLACSDVGLERKFVEEAIALAQRFDLPDFAPFRQTIVGREQPVTLTLGRLTFNGVVDLVGQDWVLDFKTDQEMTPQHHRFQLWAYAEALKRQTAHIAYLRHDHLHTFSVSDLEATSQEAQTLVQGILNEHYPTMPSHSNCRWCTYAEVCSTHYHSSPDGESSVSKG